MKTRALKPGEWVIVDSPALHRVWAYAEKLEVPPLAHVARWIEVSHPRIAVRGRCEDALFGIVKKVEPIYKKGKLVGVKAYV